MNFINILSVFIILALVTLLLEALFRYLSLTSNIFDLGIFLNSNFNFIDEYQRGLNGHAHGFLPLVSFAYNWFPPVLAPLFLIFIQWFSLSLSVLLVWRFLGLVAGLAMVLYYPVWVIALFDFHFDFLAVLILSLFFIFCARQQFVYASLVAIFLVFVKEPFALQAVFCGLYLFSLAFRPNNKSWRLQLFFSGILLFVWGWFWFYSYIRWILPYFGGVESVGIASDAFSWLGSSISEIFWSLLLSPGSLLEDIIDTPGKIKYLLVVFGLLGFISLLSPSPLIVAAPILLISMASHLPNYYDYATHYTAGLILPVIVAFRGGFAVVRAKYTAAFATQTPLYAIGLALLLGGHWALASSPISRLFWSEKVWSYSWRAYIPTAREENMKNAMLQYVPADPGVSVSSQNTVNWGHLAHRKAYLPFPLGVIHPHKVIDFSNRDLAGLWQFVRTGYMSEVITRDTYADYVVLDLKRPWFIVDSGCDWLYGACRNEQKAAEFLNFVALTLERYDVIYSLDGFMILRRRS